MSTLSRQLTFGPSSAVLTRAHGTARVPVGDVVVDGGKPGCRGTAGPRFCTENIPSGTITCCWYRLEGGGRWAYVTSTWEVLERRLFRVDRSSIWVSSRVPATMSATVCTASPQDTEDAFDGAHREGTLLAEIFGFEVGASQSERSNQIAWTVLTTNGWEQGATLGWPCRHAKSLA